LNSSKLNQGKLLNCYAEKRKLTMHLNKPYKVSQEVSCMRRESPPYSVLSEGSASRKSSTKRSCHNGEEDQDEHARPIKHRLVNVDHPISIDGPKGKGKPLMDITKTPEPWKLNNASTAQPSFVPLSNARPPKKASSSRTVPGIPAAPAAKRVPTTARKSTRIAKTEEKRLNEGALSRRSAIPQAGGGQLNSTVKCQGPKSAFKGP
jgi:hypothetical protein